MVDYLFLEPLKYYNQEVYKLILNSYNQIRDDIVKSFNNIKEINAELDKVISLEYEGAKDVDVFKVFHYTSFFLEVATTDEMREVYLSQAILALDEVISKKKHILYYDQEIMVVLEALAEVISTFVENKKREITWLNIIHSNILNIVGNTKLQDIINCANDACNVTIEKNE